VTGMADTDIDAVRKQKKAEYDKQRIAAMRIIFTRIGCTLFTFQSVLFIVFCLLLLSNGINVGIGHTCHTRCAFKTILQ
jgi:hypothetical protein